MQISAVVDVAKMVGVSRLIRGYSITSPVCDPHLDPEKEKAMRRKYMDKALAMLQEEGREGEFQTIE